MSSITNNKKVKLVPIRKSKGTYEYDKKISKGIVQGSIVLNRAFGNITVHFHFNGTANNEITLKSGDKLILEARKINGNDTHFGNKGLYKLPIITSAFIGKCKTIQEFEKQCAEIDGKEKLFNE